MAKPTTFWWLLILALGVSSRLQASEKFLEISVEDLDDKIRGGMLAQVIGNLNGLPHEFKYIDEPGSVEEYTPALPVGAFTDDDTDIEWVYLRAIANRQRCILPPSEIASLWKRHINRRIFCANHYARQLMDLGFEPPWTGNAALNPWSEFNISGQFLCESFGLMAPAMPQTAARIGLNYTRVAIDGEPAQTTQLFTTMISLAFVESDIDRLLDAGLAAVDPRSEIASVVRDVRIICAANPDDWRAARHAIKERWQVHGGAIRDRNGYELNTACTIAALIYGKKDLVETLRIAFNLGWDCDNNAATAATIVGVIKGRRWIDSQGWDIADVYKNTTRDEMPMDETLTGLETTLSHCALAVIVERGGELSKEGDTPTLRIPIEAAANIAPLATPAEQAARARKEYLPTLEQRLSGAGAERAQAAYMALCLGKVKHLQDEVPDDWAAAVAELKKFPGVLKAIFKAPQPGGELIQEQARMAGLAPPAK